MSIGCLLVMLLSVDVIILVFSIILVLFFVGVLFIDLCLLVVKLWICIGVYDYCFLFSVCLVSDVLSGLGNIFGYSVNIVVVKVIVFSF